MSQGDKMRPWLHFTWLSHFQTASGPQAPPLSPLSYLVLEIAEEHIKNLSPLPSAKLAGQWECGRYMIRVHLPHSPVNTPLGTTAEHTYLHILHRFLWSIIRKKVETKKVFWICQCPWAELRGVRVSGEERNSNSPTVGSGPAHSQYVTPNAMQPPSSNVVHPEWLHHIFLLKNGSKIHHLVNKQLFNYSILLCTLLPCWCLFFCVLLRLV